MTRPSPPGGIPWVLSALGQHQRQQLVATELRGYGIDVHQASSGLAAFAELQQVVQEGRELPLVLADMALAVRDGLLLLSDLRFAGIEAPYVLVTDEPAFHAAARTFGAVAVGELIIDLENLAVVMELARAAASDLYDLLRERRRHDRVTMEMEMWVEKRDAQATAFTRCSSLSEGGMALRQDWPEKLGEQFSLSFYLPGQPGGYIDATCRVANVRPVDREFILGMEFLELPPTAHQRIAEFWSNG